LQEANAYAEILEKTGASTNVSLVMLELWPHEILSYVITDAMSIIFVRL